MSALEAYRSSDQVIPPDAPMYYTSPPDPTGGRLMAWANSLSAAHQIATALANTAFAPAHFKGRPNDAAAAILYGDEIGLTPTAALRSVFVIGGTPGLYARTMAALVMSRGHQLWTVEESEQRVTVAGRRRGSDREETATWTIDRARRAGYTNNAQYSKNPQAMLYARALGDVARRIAPDVLAGLALTAEELQDAEPEATTPVTRASATTGRTRVARTRPATVEAPEPPLKPEAPAAATDVPPAAAEPAEPERYRGGITGPQMRKLQAAYRDRGLSGDAHREARLDDASGRVGAEVLSFADLSAEDASRLIDSLEAPAPDGDEPPLEPDGWA